MASNARHRSFASKKNRAKREPISFDLLDGEYTFECKPVVQGAVLIDFIAAAGSNDGAASAAELTNFIHAALKDAEEQERFEKVIRSEDPEDNVEIEDLSDIVAWLVEEYTSRPTQAS